MFHQQQKMKHIKLLPNRFGKIGLVLAVVGTVGLILGFMDIIPIYESNDVSLLNSNHKVVEEISGDISFSGKIGHTLENSKLIEFSDEVIWTLILVGLVFTGFSKVKVEDEFTERIRLRAAFIAIWSSVGYGLICNWCFYGGDFLNVVLFAIGVPVLAYNFVFWTIYLKSLRNA